MEDGILIGGSNAGKVSLNPRYANRHGLVAGATGTGKTVTLQCLAEGFSDIGVPVFLADVKGDISGISQAGKPHPKVDERVQKIGIENFSLQSYPVSFWDLFGKKGTPVRATVSEMGPQMLSRLLQLNETQESVMTLVFEFADGEGMLLVDLKYLRSTLEYLGEHSRELGTGYGVSKASVNAILRRLLMIEREGGKKFFGEPALQLQDFMQTTRDGRGVINVLAADQLIMSPRVYSTFLLWLLSELFENLPELGDPDKPVLVFFFDEAHLLFSHAPKALLEKITQVVRLIRSKGVGVFFVTQYPNDVPDEVIGQLGNRIQHALRAYTPNDRKALRAAAQTFRANPAFDTEEVIGQLGVGEALISTLDAKGVPSVVERTLMAPPRSQFGPIDDVKRTELIGRSPLNSAYEQAVDRESAYEMLARREEELVKQRQREAEEAARIEAEEARRRKDEKAARSGSRRQGIGEALAKSVVRTIGSSLGRQIVRGILGSIIGRR